MAFFRKPPLSTWNDYRAMIADDVAEAMLEGGGDWAPIQFIARASLDTVGPDRWVRVANVDGDGRLGTSEEEKMTRTLAGNKGHYFPLPPERRPAAWPLLVDIGS